MSRNGELLGQSAARNLKSENNTDDDFENALTKLLNEYTFRNKVSKFAFLFVPEDSWGESTLYRAYKDINISDLIKSNSNYWIDRQGRTLNYDSLIFKRSGGKSFCYNSQFSSDIVKHIKNNTKNLTNAFYVRLSHNFKYVYLDDVLSPYNDVCSDGDGWTDWQEVNTKFLKFNDDGTFTLPTFNEYLNAIENEQEKKSIREVFSDTNDGIGISFISRTKININDPRLIVWWEKSGHRQKATEYNNRVIELLNNATSDEEVIDGIRKIMNSYGFKVNF